ncbi:S8 family serine peptidase [Kribbella albertanoniae]|uniref:Peptidase S8/S53 subtilisin kexin sedolisin n=1 Tax=Kribbella albertanoniae TaxID=1266829 RepID=A0A4R4QAN5_9ACTN|nr:S8 family serine peptidase [Kribbella albertanoniae]TDC32189.1 peptidase S8/S53 subtilisin kexin sedolisin [Kribbella albertanoniae]
MRRSTRAMSATVLAALGIVLAVRAAAADPPNVTAPVSVPAQEVAGAVTLITGDKVIVTPGAEPRIERAAGREAVPIRVKRSAGHLQVLPADAVARIANGTLDPRLFDVTILLESGYGDDKRPELPLILQHGRSSARSVPSGFTVDRQLPALGATAVHLAKSTSADFWKSQHTTLRSAAVTKVWLDGVRHPVLDNSARQVSAPAAWQRGITGQGVPVAVLDSGIDTTHPDLGDAVIAARSFVGDEPTDNYGHGTHVASIVTGASSKYRGIAPDAKLLNGKVCDDGGYCPESAMLAGMEWAAAEQRARVINMSVGGPDGPGVDLVEQAVNDLTKAYDTLFVIAAGNSGAGGDRTVESPGSADAALTVGAVTREDALTEFSSRGPRIGDSAMKPDLTAPGDGIVAAQATGTESGEPVEAGYVRLSGTSMATPHVAGAAALLRQQHPQWTAEQVKATLMGTAKIGPDTAFASGAGRLDVAAAIDAGVAASPASVSFGLAQWPHEDDEVLARTVIYRNSGDQPVTLQLELQTPGSQVTPFSLAASELTVPAGGQAQVEVKADTKAAVLPVGLYSGRIVATGGGAQLSTPIGVEKEDERYGVKVTLIGRDGKAPEDAVTYFDRLGDCSDVETCSPYLVGGAATELRVAPGDYSIGHFSSTGSATSLLVEPTFRVAADTALTLDARMAGEVTMSVPNAGARLVQVTLAVGRALQRPGEALTYSAAGTAGQSLHVAAAKHGTAPADELVTVVQGRFAEPGPAGDFTDTPYEYNLGRAFPGQVPSGVRLRPKAGDFAKVLASYASDAPAGEFREAITSHGAVPPGGSALLALGPDTVKVRSSKVPFERTEYFLSIGVEWHHLFAQQGKPFPLGQAQYFAAKPVSYRAGHTYRSDWQRGVLGPRLSTGPISPNGLARGAQRQGDRLILGLSLRSDNDPNHLTDPRTPAGSLRLTRNGEVIYDRPRAGFVAVAVPAETSEYVLHSRVKVPETAVSTEIDTTWTFRSGQVDGIAGLPLMTVQFAPRLDDHNGARPGPFLIPVSVQRQPGSEPATVKSVAVEFSTDGGTTWQPAGITRSSSGWLARVSNPATGSVSLRSTAVDSLGGKVEQTIASAYLMRR